MRQKKTRLLGKTCFTKIVLGFLIFACNFQPNYGITSNEGPFGDGNVDVSKTSPNPNSAPNQFQFSNSENSSKFSYVVRPGDNLWKIAKKYLGSGFRYWEIVELNKSKYPSLIKNPNLIHPGWVFQIPGSGENALPAGNKTKPRPPSKPTTPASSGTPPNPYTPKPPSGSAITTKSPEFKGWWDEALKVAETWQFPQTTNKFGLPVTRADFLKAIMYVESRGIHRKSDGSLVRSYAGAMGFMQLMPGTASGLKVDPNDPRQNLLGGTRYLGKCLTSPAASNPNDSPADLIIKAAAGYNRGPYAKELKNKSWNQYVTTGISENVKYGIFVKMCLGYNLTSDEISWMINRAGVSSAGVSRMADQYYRYSHGLVQ